MLEKRRILLFPASQAQREAFVAARELGLEIVAVDRNPEAACRPLADVFASIDPGDADALVAFALEQHRLTPLSGVLVVGCDLPVSCARVAQALGTPAISLEAAALTVDKLRMKQVLRECGVAVPDFYPVQNAEEVSRLLDRLNRPMVIKPNDNCGARGVQQLFPGDDCQAAFAQAAANIKRQGVILEVFEPGMQISIEALVVKGEIHITGFADRNYEYLSRFRPYILENGATLPTALSPEQKTAVETLFAQGVRALGINDSVAKGDMVLGPEGAKIIEIAGRVSGGKFASMIVPEATGVRLLHAALQVAVGLEFDPVSLRPNRDKGVAVRYMFPPAGRLVALEGVEAARRIPGVVELVTCYAKGDVIGPMHSHASRGGWVVCVARDRATAVSTAQRAIAAVRFVTESP